MKQKIKYSIFQVKRELLGKFGFKWYDLLVKTEGVPNIKNYNKVFCKKIKINTELSHEHILNKLFKKFNLNHQKKYCGRSMSVSDIVILNKQMWYCDDIGWKLIELRK